MRESFAGRFLFLPFGEALAKMPGVSSSFPPAKLARWSVRGHLAVKADSRTNAVVLLTAEGMSGRNGFDKQAAGGS
jgi:hypothetical protein